MAIEFDDRELRLIGNNARHIGFYDNSRALRATIYLDENNNLNIGGLQLSTASNDEGDGLDLADVPFLAIAASPLLNNERVIAAGDGLQATDQGGGNNYTLRLGTPGTLSAQSSAAVTSNSHTHPITASANPGAAESLLKSTSGGALTLRQLNVDNVRLDGNTLSAQSGDLTLTAAGGDVVLPSAINIGADNFVSQLTGWRVDYDGSADFRSIYADELHVKAFIADIEQALAGGQIISKSVAILSRDFVVPLQASLTSASVSGNYFQVAGDHTGAIDIGQAFVVANSPGNNGQYSVGSITYFSGIDRTRIVPNESVSDDTAAGEIRMRRNLFVEDLPGFADTAAFADGDWVRLRVIDRSGGGLVVADVWGSVNTHVDLSGGEQLWSFYARDSGGVAGNVVNAGAIVLDYGQSGDGWHEITALDSDGPYSQIVTWETDPTNSANYTLRSRLGNLDGVTDSDFPDIGGWGLYSTNAYLKGVVTAAAGAIVLDDDGITIDGSLGEDTPSIILWRDGPGGAPAFRLGTTIDSGGNMSGAILQNEVTGGVLHLLSDNILLQGTTTLSGQANMDYMQFNERSTTPTGGTAGDMCRVYMKADKFIIRYTEGGTTRYKYLDLTGSSVTWVHTTTAP